MNEVRMNCHSKEGFPPGLMHPDITNINAKDHSVDRSFLLTSLDEFLIFLKE